MALILRRDVALQRLSFIAGCRIDPALQFSPLRKRGTLKLDTLAHRREKGVGDGDNNY